VVGRRATVSLGPSGAKTRGSTIVFVGDQGGIDTATLGRLFDACAARPISTLVGVTHWLRSFAGKK
jgi:hypothetical protein